MSVFGSSALRPCRWRLVTAMACFGWGAFTRQPEGENAHISGSRPTKTPPKFHEQTPQREKKRYEKTLPRETKRHEKTPREKKTREDPWRERKKERTWGREREKSAKFWASHASGPPLLWALPLGPPPSGSPLPFPLPTPSTTLSSGPTVLKTDRGQNRPWPKQVVAKTGHAPCDTP